MADVDQNSPEFTVNSQSLRDSLSRENEDIYRYGEQYNNVIILIAFGGLLALFSTSGGSINPVLKSISGICIIISINAFALFEIVKMFVRAFRYNEMNKIIDLDDFDLRLADLNRRLRILKKYTGYSWYLLFSISLIFYIVSSVFLMSGFINSFYVNFCS